MSVSASTLRKLALLNLSSEQMAGVLDILADGAEAEEARRAAIAARTRRYRQRGGDQIPDDMRAAVMARDGATCQECGSKDYPQIDHIYPVSKGGETSPDNLQVLCRPCNARKRDRIRKSIPRNSTELTRNSADNPSPKESPPTPPKEITPSPEPNGSLGVGKARASDLSEFKSELSDLDAERLEAIVKHRRSKRGQLTGLSARLFRSDATACGLSLSEAVDTCISRNWITVKPEFLAGRNAPPRQSTSPPSRERTVSDALGEMAAGTWKPPGHDHEPDFPTIETSFHRRN